MTSIDIALAETRALQASFKRLETTLESLREQAAHGQASFLPPCDVPVTQHRREHRAGFPAIIDSNPSLRAFILARLDRLTFKQIADEIAQHTSRLLCTSINRPSTPGPRGAADPPATARDHLR